MGCLGVQKHAASSDVESGIRLSKREKTLVDSLSLEELWAGYNLLSVLSRAELSVEEIPRLQKNCGDIGAEDAARLMLPLRALLDEKIRLHWVDDGREEDAWASSCTGSCSCGAYSLALERKPTFVGITEKEKQNYDQIERATESEQRGAFTCAQRNPWFCQSELFLYLKVAAKDYGG